MRIINVRNVHEALPEGIRLLQEEGLLKQTRNGLAMMAPWPVATVYSHPWERVIFHPERDANPFFHLYEMLWMLDGRNDVEPLIKYASNFGDYSDDGRTIHDAYGYRWRKHFSFDQIPKIINALIHNPGDRRCVLQMWDPKVDLGFGGKAFPCNLTVTFSRAATGALDMVVFNRSNDIIWGAYGANAVHFSFLQEYMAYEMECPMGTYTQISTNFHAYGARLTDELLSIPAGGGIYNLAERNPYTFRNGKVKPTRLTGVDPLEIVEDLLEAELHPRGYRRGHFPFVWADVAMAMFQAHHVWKNTAAPERYTDAIAILASHPAHDSDWIVAGIEWLKRRQDKWEIKMANEHTTLGSA